MKKGSLIGVDGRVQTRNFEGQDGKRVYVTEIVADSVQFLRQKVLKVADNINLMATKVTKIIRTNINKIHFHQIKTKVLTKIKTKMIYRFKSSSLN